MTQPVFYPETYEDLSKNISDEEIYYHYFGYFEANHWYFSPFHEETKPSFTISFFKGKWVWRDFGIDPRPKDAVSFVMKYFDLDFHSALNKIFEELVLGIENKTPVKRPVPKEAPKQIRCKIWTLSKSEAYYWLRRSIDADACKYYKIYGGTVINNDKLALSGYVYLFDKEKKIWKGYDPKEKILKFFSHNISDHIQNYNELTKTHNFWGKEYNKSILFITKSYKDCIILNFLGYHAIAPHSENMFLAPWDVDYLRSLFPYIYVFYDNDHTGVTKCTEFTTQHKLSYINIPKSIKSSKTGETLKDPDEVVVEYGYALLNNIIHTKLKRDGITESFT